MEESVFAGYGAAECGFLKPAEVFGSGWRLFLFICAEGEDRNGISFMRSGDNLYRHLCGIFFAFWMGTMAGVFLSVASIRYGLKGIALIAAGILPQYLLLVPACIMLMSWCYQLSAALYHPEKAADFRYGTKKQYLMRKAAQFLVILGIIIIGSAMESYINPMLLSAFLKIF